MGASMFSRVLRGDFFYGWVIVGITVVVLIGAAGIRSAAGVMILPMQGETGWALSTISLSVSLGLLLFGFTGPFSGALMERFGLRNMVLVGLLMIAASMIVSARMTTQWELFLFWGILSGVGSGLIGTVLGATVASRWFVANRGLVVGIFGAATSAGQLIFLPLLMQLVLSLGWRTTTLILAGIMLALLLPVFLVLRDDPADVGLRPYGAPADMPPAASLPKVGMLATMQQATRTPEFWLLASTFFVCGFTSTGLIGTHLIPYAVDCGIAEITAAGMLALMGAMNFIGTITSGWLTDRYDPRKLLAIYYSFRGLSLLLLPWINTPAGLAFFAVLFGLDYIATVPPTVSLVADTFGRRQVGIVYGWVFCAHQVGAALAAWLGGVTREVLGGYGVAFFAAGVLAVLAGLLALRIQRRALLMPVAEASA
jgi:MFS family permease